MAKAKGRGKAKAEAFMGVFIMAAGILVLCYPLVLQMRSRMAADEAVSSYEQAQAAAGPDILAEHMQAAREYNARLAASQGGVMIPEGDEASENDREYQSLLADSGPMATISIPSIDVNLPIYHGTTDSVLTAGAGHLYGTSLPVGGESTNAVIAAHRGSPSALMFTRLDELGEGDVFYITVLGQRHAYQVDQIHVVAPGDTSLFSITEGEDHVTLLTCTPYGVNTSRLVVRGTRLTEAQEAALPDSVDAPRLSFYPAGYICCIIALAALLACSTIAGTRRQHRRPHALHLAS